jgi:hypothetical protein
MTRSKQAILPPPPSDAPESGVVLRGSEASSSSSIATADEADGARVTRLSSGVTPLRPPTSTPTMPIADVVRHDDIPMLVCDVPPPPDALLAAVARAIDGKKSVRDLAMHVGCAKEIVLAFVAELDASGCATVQRKRRDSREYWLEGLRPRARRSNRAR